MLAKLISISHSISHKRDYSHFNHLPADTKSRCTSAPSCSVDHGRKEKSQELMTSSVEIGRKVCLGGGEAVINPRSIKVSGGSGMTVARLSSNGNSPEPQRKPDQVTMSNSDALGVANSYCSRDLTTHDSEGFPTWENCYLIL